MSTPSKKPHEGHFTLALFQPLLWPSNLCCSKAVGELMLCLEMMAKKAKKVRGGEYWVQPAVGMLAGSTKALTEGCC